ncbi:MULTISPECIES: ribosomal protein S18-alanine N-acetyltransferase [Vibrio]|uniref:ribosomal protein S18-alanine N-acetyltransferase n=1 Tax=Vibrio TaxID=662 RepID=UPI001EFC8940|nr:MULTISPECIES: ribosomal protein S18-alanine N-acetyltransferase [Vibrio]MCG9678175.1 ribosomal protein S18-alanine N-acetyltransferase [Vibrio sp. Isolate24]USD32062.1 ribosomal protein S18-alanine N-acetyltransferase [Vibrio sp. SCSIO 43186]USD45103.1 ribosomal protein S18-alanine N-acetyltransferase [Vibrio sp. SCSIO 43145]USD69185.1 ribosomal protein S18-alanine N-acetyltransferase [Vibrio sp. SCSIO 43139]USD96875.1 ribosomal-protein-alanine N-acetyltransferase [Vibrio coralliilyticus]
MTLLPLAEAHLDSVYSIETQAHSHPWSEAMIRDVTSRGACHHVLLDDNTVVGYFYAQNIVGEVTLLNIAVDPTQQGKGYGKQLIESFLTMCEQLNAESAWLEVRESNTRAANLYEAVGFNEVDRRVNYYPTTTGKEDAIIMSYIFF